MPLGNIVFHVFPSIEILKNQECINDIDSDNGMGWMKRDGNPVLPMGRFGGGGNSRRGSGRQPANHVL